MNNDIDLRQYPREGPSTMNVSSRENRNLEPATVHVQQHSAEAPNISNERELMELQDDTLEADMEHPTKICRIYGIGWPDLWVPNVCNCSGERSVVHPVCMQYHAIDKSTHRCSVGGVNQLTSERDNTENAEQEESTLSWIRRSYRSNKATFLVYLVIILVLSLFYAFWIPYLNAPQNKKKKYFE